MTVVQLEITMKAVPGFGAGKLSQYFLLPIILLISLCWVSRAGAGLFDDEPTPPKRSEQAASARPSGPLNSSPQEAPNTQPTEVPGSALPGSTRKDRHSVPDPASRVKARKVFEEVYAEALKGRSPTARRKLAQQLIDEAGKADAGSVDRFVLLSGAIQAAEEAQSLPLCFIAAHDLAGEFDVDELATKSKAVVKVYSTSMSPELASSSNIQSLLDFSEKLLAVDDFVAIAPVESVLRRVLPMIPDGDLKVQVADQIRNLATVREATQRISPQLAKLKKSPNDPAANFAVGIYRCFVRGQWQEGLPELAKSNDGRLRDVAVAELAHPKAVESICKLAERWLAEAPSQPALSRANIMLHAADLYRSAKAIATGLEAALIDRKLAAIPQANRTRRIDLLQIFDPATSVCQGKWHMEDGCLVSDPGDFARAQFAYTPPEEYDFLISFSVVEGGEEVGQICYCSGHQFSYELGNAGDSYAGFELIDGVQTRKTQSARKKSRWLIPGQHYVSVVKVRKWGIEAYLNGQLVTGLRTDFSNLSLDGARRLSRNDILGISTYLQEVRFDAVEVIEITGEGRFISQSNQAQK